MATVAGEIDFAAVSNNLSLAVQASPFYPGLISLDEAGLRWHVATGIPLFSWSSQARGFFTGAFRPEFLEKFIADKNSFGKRMLEVYGTSENMERLRRAELLGREKGNVSAVQIALAWIMHQPINVVPLVGPHAHEELISCRDALLIKLSGREIKWLNLECDSL